MTKEGMRINSIKARRAQFAAPIHQIIIIISVDASNVMYCKTLKI